MSTHARRGRYLAVAGVVLAIAGVLALTTALRGQQDAPRPPASAATAVTRSTDEKAALSYFQPPPPMPIIEASRMRQGTTKAPDSAMRAMISSVCGVHEQVCEAVDPSLYRHPGGVDVQGASCGEDPVPARLGDAGVQGLLVEHGRSIRLWTARICPGTL